MVAVGSVDGWLEPHPPCFLSTAYPPCWPRPCAATAVAVTQQVGFDPGGCCHAAFALGRTLLPRVGQPDAGSARLWRFHIPRLPLSADSSHVVPAWRCRLARFLTCAATLFAFRPCRCRPGGVLAMRGCCRGDWSLSCRSLPGGLLFLPLPADAGCDSGRFRYSDWYRRRPCLHIAALHERPLRRVTGTRWRNPSRYLVRAESNVVFSAQVGGRTSCNRRWRDRERAQVCWCDA